MRTAVKIAATIDILLNLSVKPLLVVLLIESVWLVNNLIELSNSISVGI